MNFTLTLIPLAPYVCLIALCARATYEKVQKSIEETRDQKISLSSQLFLSLIIGIYQQA